ncbi:MAG: hypothetical protein GEU82_01720 [Luteitalea sp.]|nr:hypothetical protein [Luteitalea sp.]
MDVTRRTRQAVSVSLALAAVALSVAMIPRASAQGRGQAVTRSLSDPLVTDPIIQGSIDMHAHQDPDSRGPSYGQAARSIDAIDLVKRAKMAGMRGFVIKQHLDQTAGLAYYIRKLYPEMEVFGGMGSNLTIGPKVNPWAITHMTEIKGGWGRIVWMPSWDSEHSSHEVKGWKQPAFVSVARCPGGGPFWANYPKPCANPELLPEVKEAMSVIAKAKTRDSNGDLILATGHNGPEEVKLMVEEAVKVGVKHIIITHPLLSAVGMSHAQIKEVVGMGPEIYAEFTSQFGRENASAETLKNYVDGIRAAGVEHAFVSSDTGQLNSIYQPDALAMAAKALRAQGFTDKELDLLFRVNPAKILGIAPPPALSR